MAKGRTRATRNESPPRESPAIDPPSSSRKRPREAPADAPLSAPESAPSDVREPESTEARPTKKSKAHGDSSDKMTRPEHSEDGEPARVSPRSSSLADLESTSSDTLAESVATDRAQPDAMDADEPTTLDPILAARRRELKGKAKATPQDDDAELPQETELARLTRQLAHQTSLLASQAALLSNLRSVVACTVCLETLDKPYALACGHVFCRKCLIEWFFRPDPDAEPDRDPEDGSSSDTDVDSDTSDSESNESGNSASSGSPSTASSYVGGTLRGEQFRVRPGNAGTSQETFEAIANRIYDGFRAPGRLENGPRPAAGQPAAPAAAIREIVEVESDDDDEEKDDEEGSTQLDADELRKARLARFGGDESTVVTEAAGSAMNATTSSTAPAATITTTNSPPRPRERSPPPPPPPPPPPKIEYILPKGRHRLKNLVCPQCRTGCSELAPHRIFVLAELVQLVRTSEHTNAMPGLESDGDKVDPDAGEGSTTRSDLPGMDENDNSWGGLFPGAGGTETARDRRKRLAQFIRDRDDGVTRCGECSWEIDERSGLCEGCGRRWSVSPEGDDLDDSSGFEFGFGSRVPRIRGERYTLSRRHDDVFRSDRSSDRSSQDGASGSDDYESDDFLVRSGAEEDEEECNPRRRSNDKFESEEEEEEDGDSSDQEEERRQSRRRRQRRQQGEVIDLESNTESESDSDDTTTEDDDSISSSSRRRKQDKKTKTPIVLSETDSEEEDESDEPRIDDRNRHEPEHSRPTTSKMHESSGEEEEERHSTRTRRKKRVIADDSEGSD
ncbi:uncharacterized protein JCM15063_004378 [Sporobolomyces koalae]|uniref:uncharacterized protein n=1 Tax=Sporobolomyces koalae TaxID=500713 RepID=UPI00317D8E73